MEKLVSARLGDLVKVYIGGDAPKGYTKEKSDFNFVPIYSNGVEDEGLYGYTNSPKVEGDSVTISARGNVGAAFYRNQSYVPIVRLLALVPNRDLINPKYLFYLLKLDSIISTGAAQQQITAPQIKKHRITFSPNITYQNKIASILSAYDSQIENNQKRIKLLEQMAENLYKEWFVRFRFPGYETAEFKSSSLGNIPDTFTVENMGNVLDYYIGGGWGQDAQSEEYPQDAYVIRGADFPRVQSGDVTSCPYRYHKTSNYKARQLKPLDVILEVSGGTQEQPVGRTVIVTENLLNRLDNKVICASFCKQLRLDKSKVLPFYYYYWMKFVYDTRMIDKFQLQSTGIINFKFEYFLRKGLISIPPMSLMKQFSDIIEPLFAEKDLLSEQINHLTRQRDLLLPRLMSGKLEVKGE